MRFPRLSSGGAILATLATVNFMAIINISIVNVALPAMQSDLNTDMAGLQWVINAFTLCLSALTLTGGSLGDRYGRKRVFLFGVLLFLAGSVVCGLATQLPMLITGRLVQGVGAAMLIPGSLSILAQTFTDPAERARRIGVWAAVSSIGLAAGPVLGGVLIDAYGWPAIFWAGVPVGVLGFIGTLVIVPESSDPRHASLDLPGQFLGIAALGALSYGLIRLGDTPDVWAVSTLAASVVLLTVFIVVEWRTVAPMLPVRMFTDRHFMVMNVASAALGFAPYAIYAFLSLFMQQVQNLTATEAGLAFLPMALATGLVAPLAGRWTGRVGPRPALILGYSMSTLGVAGLLLLDADSGYGIMGPVYVLIGLGIGLSMTPTTTAAVTAVPRERSGIASATVNTTRQTGMALGVALLGAIVAANNDFVTGMHLAALLAAFVSLVALILVFFNAEPTAA
ncbi:EmrB/QacA subfamily drug resistance transporter [Stackebrandtia endophytica]|uniref:EmrB/QacA subfamily drug resistance transporter n=1 Tax=Stackebrandtia endophytica TaxID=1496996 RepID=A0A543B195_9ACTN|nr:MFS transporter [Stackebrandtia endophytica]TQL78607.1 EmrB/QacA subfamily drug resistance transporter [Stackebrandtia endophytica]